jgi:GAF domain-containing protein
MDTVSQREDPRLNESIVDEASQRAQRLSEDGAPVFESLAVLVSAAERIGGPGSVSSILVLDSQGLLRNGASPNLPRDYLDAIDRLKPDPRVGTCAAAAATGEVVLTPDFHADEKWGELRHLPLALGFVGAWSQPIKNPEGRVLGTFGTYFRSQRAPTEAERRGVEQLAGVAAKVLDARRPSGHA